MADRSPAQGYALVFGAALLGFIIGSGDVILSIVPVNTEDDVLHLLIGIAGIAAFAATQPLRERVRPATA